MRPRTQKKLSVQASCGPPFRGLFKLEHGLLAQLHHGPYIMRGNQQNFPTEKMHQQPAGGSSLHTGSPAACHQNTLSITKTGPANTIKGFKFGLSNKLFSRLFLLLPLLPGGLVPLSGSFGRLIGAQNRHGLAFGLLLGLRESRLFAEPVISPDSALPLSFFRRHARPLLPVWECTCQPCGACIHSNPP